MSLVEIHAGDVEITVPDHSCMRFFNHAVDGWYHWSLYNTWLLFVFSSTICLWWTITAIYAHMEAQALLQYKKILSYQYWKSHCGYKTVARSSCLVHPGVRDKCRVSEIDLSQPRHTTAFWWRHNGPVTSQSTDPIKWPNHPLELIEIYVYINTHNKESLTQRCRRSTNIQLCLIFCTYPYGLGLIGWHSLFCIANNRHGVTITTHAIKRHFLIWMTMVRQPTKRRYSCVLTIKYTFICINWWTRQRIHNTLIVVDRYLRHMGDKTIADSAEPRLESFYPPFVAGIDLPHQGVVDSYNLHNGNPYTGEISFRYWFRARVSNICFMDITTIGPVNFLSFSPKPAF